MYTYRQVQGGKGMRALAFWRWKGVCDVEVGGVAWCFASGRNSLRPTFKLTHSSRPVHECESREVCVYLTDRSINPFYFVIRILNKSNHKCICILMYSACILKE